MVKIVPLSDDSESVQTSRDATFRIEIVSVLSIESSDIDEEFLVLHKCTADVSEWNNELLAEYIRWEGAHHGPPGMATLGYLLLGDWGAESGDWEIDVEWTK
ncbi:MAG: hypothetical protein EBU08_00380 [Micrococcales bacterium]|nr:hypothetical protein [Micrococcales bacterium]